MAEVHIELFDRMVHKDVLVWEFSRLEAITKLSQLVTIVRHNVEKRGVTMNELKDITGCPENALLLIVNELEKHPHKCDSLISEQIWDKL